MYEFSLVKPVYVSKNQPFRYLWRALYVQGTGWRPVLIHFPNFRLESRLLPSVLPSFPLFTPLITALLSQWTWAGVSEGLQGGELGLRSSQGFSCRAGSLLLLSSPTGLAQFPEDLVLSSLWFSCAATWAGMSPSNCYSALTWASSSDFSLGVISLMSTLA